MFFSITIFGAIILLSPILILGIVTTFRLKNFELPTFVCPDKPLLGLEILLSPIIVLCPILHLLLKTLKFPIITFGLI